MKKLVALILAMVMALACFAGCGTESIVVGYTIYAPMNYLDESGNLIGFDTDLAKAVFEGLGYDVIFQEIEWSSKYTDLNSDTIDCVWNGFTCNTADEEDGILRSEKVDFSYNYMENRQVVVAKKDAGIASAADLSGKIVAVEQSGEFYGLMDICGKGASFFGMALVGFINQITADVEVHIFGLRLQNANIAVSALVILFIIGYAIFCKADKLNKARKAA